MNSSEEADIRQAALEYLESHHVMTLATCGEKAPWAAAVFYASEGFNLVFLSAGHTRHIQDLKHRPRVAAAIQEDYRDWLKIKGIQLEGTVRQLDGHQRQEAIDLYGTKFTFIASAGSLIQAALKRIDWYLLEPDRLYFVDNSRGFGHRDEIVLR